MVSHKNSQSKPKVMLQWYTSLAQPHYCAYFSYIACNFTFTFRMIITEFHVWNVWREKIGIIKIPRGEVRYILRFSTLNECDNLTDEKRTYRTHLMLRDHNDKFIRSRTRGRRPTLGQVQPILLCLNPISLQDQPHHCHTVHKSDNINH